MARCRGCQAEIGFVRLRSGKFMPVESEEPEEYCVWTDRASMDFSDHAPAYEKLVLVVEGEILTVWRGFHADAAKSGGRRYVDGPCRILGVESHFASCPEAEAFRR